MREAKALAHPLRLRILRLCFQEELREAGPAAIQTFSRFTLHLSPDEADELDRRILAILDEYVETDADRRDRPALGGIFVLHRLADH